MQSQAIPEIRSTNPRSRDYSDYPRELHHNPPGPSRYPTAPSLGPSPPNHRSRFPVNDNSSSSHRSTNGHGSGYYDRSRTQPEVHLPMHSGPPSRNNGSDSRNGGPSNPAPRVQTPEQTGRGSLPPIYTLTQATVPTVPSHLPPMNSNGRRSLGNPYPQPLTPPPPHTDSRYHYNGYAPHPHNSHVSMERPVEFQNVEAGEKSKSKRRGNLPKQTTDILRAWLHEHLDHAYPNEEEKQQLIRETGLSKYSPELLSRHFRTWRSPFQPCPRSFYI